MEVFEIAELTIPLGHLAVFIILSAFCLLCSRYKLALAITFSFTFYWGFIYNKDVIFSHFIGASSPFMLLYFLSGCLLVLFALCALVLQD